MDGKLGQYAAYVTTCASREEPVQNLQEATSALLDAFSRRNHGATPRKIIVYRDGVSDNQFESILEREVTAYKEALALTRVSDYVSMVDLTMATRARS
jgi:eukaryotic translation initiation factor 2C